MKKLIGIGILAGVLMALAGFAVNYVFELIYPSFKAIYSNTDIFIGWDDPRMNFFWLYPITLGIALAWLYGMLPKKAKEPFAFAGIYFFVGALPAFFINVGSFNLPVMMIASWSIMSYVNGLIAGLLFKKMLK